MNDSRLRALVDGMRRVLQVSWRAGAKFLEIDGEQRAASFAYYAFFALFPLILLFVTIGSQFLESGSVERYVVENLGRYLPFNTADQGIVETTIHGVLDAWGRASVIAIWDWCGARRTFSMPW